MFSPHQMRECNEVMCAFWLVYIVLIILQYDIFIKIQTSIFIIFVLIALSSNA
jgi:hypothetical protein